MTEKEKAKLGMWYDANNDEELLAQRVKAKSKCFQYNQTDPLEQTKKDKILEELFGNLPDGLEIIQPFLCDYGNHIHLQEHVFINSNCYFMDCADIMVGKHVFIGPNCGFYTAQHPLDYVKRNAGLELAKPITIGDNVWLGGNVVVLPGISIGEGTVIGAGSVVTKDIPSGVIAIGNPCRVLRKITDEDKTGL